MTADYAVRAGMKSPCPAPISGSSVSEMYGVGLTARQKETSAQPAQLHVQAQATFTLSMYKTFHVNLQFVW